MMSSRRNFTPAARSRFASAYLNLAQHLKTMPLMRNVPRRCRLKIGRLIVAIAPNQAVFQQRGPQTIALQRGIYTDQGKIPMWFRGVIAGHLFEYFCEITLDLPGSRALKQRHKRILIRLDARRKPERSTAVTLEVIGALVCEGFTSKCSNQLRKMRQILVRFRPCPARPWVRAKRKDQHIAHVFLIRFGRSFYYRLCHNRLSLKGSVNRLFLLIVRRTVKRVQDNSIANFPRTQLAEKYCADDLTASCPKTDVIGTAMRQHNITMAAIIFSCYPFICFDAQPFPGGEPLR
jgi:hypothetical protein